MGILLLILFILAFSLGGTALVAAVATIIVKKIWLSGNQNRYSSSTHTTTSRSKPRNEEFRTFQSRNDGKTYSPTGWAWNENTKLWDPPDYIPNDERPPKIERKQPTFEEWKAAREAEQKSDTESTT